MVYLYDDLGRLVRVIRDDGQAATYVFDPVGNLLSVTRHTGLSQTSTVTGVSQSTGGQGMTVPLTLSGTNLAGAAVVCTTPGVTVQSLRTGLDQITLDLAIALTAPTGPVDCEVQGITTAALPFSIVQTIPALLGAPSVSVAVGTPQTPLVATGVSVQVAPPLLVVDRNVLGAVSVEVETPGSALASTAVAVALEPVVTSVSPGAGAPATPSLAVRILGAGFDGATAVSFLRNNAADPDLAVVGFTVEPGGDEINVEIAIGASAPLGARVVQITTPAGTSTPLGTGGNLFSVQ